METHKHKGIVKSHPINQVHKDKNVQKWHNLSLNKITTLKNLFGKQATKKEDVVCPVKEGYISIHLPSILQTGVRITGIEAGRVKIVKGRVDGIQLDK